MKRLEQILAVIVLISLVMKLFSIPFAGELLTLSVLILIIMYTFLGKLLFNGIRFRDRNKRVYFVGIPQSSIGCALGLGIGTGMICTGVLFKIQLWPSSEIMIMSGSIVTAVSILVTLVASFKSTTKFLKRNIIRIITVAILGIASLFVSDFTLIKIYHRDHPEYLKAYENYLKNPSSLEAIRKMDIEQCKAFMTDEEFEEYMKSPYSTDSALIKIYGYPKQQ
ncbi:MAG: hypothetical protein N4A72_12415 [Bacteroidales bacterium]|jgi:hypothetical protein|nr:hypothetical protein [Bacteroidales bacterium]